MLGPEGDLVTAGHQGDGLARGHLGAVDRQSQAVEALRDLGHGVAAGQLHHAVVVVVVHAIRVGDGLVTHRESHRHLALGEAAVVDDRGAELDPGDRRGLEGGGVRLDGQRRGAHVLVHRVQLQGGRRVSCGQGVEVVRHQRGGLLLRGEFRRAGLPAAAPGVAAAHCEVDDQRDHDQDHQQAAAAGEHAGDDQVLAGGGLRDRLRRRRGEVLRALRPSLGRALGRRRCGHGGSPGVVRGRVSTG